MSTPIRLSLAFAAFLLPAPLGAWTEEDLRAAERRLERQLAAQRAAEAQAKAQAEAAAKAEADADSARKSIAAGMVVIPAGAFQMGCSPGDRDCSDDEQPPHRVKLKAFRIGKYEVTQAQWRAVMGSNPAHFRSDDRPVENVSWDDIQTFLQLLNVGNFGQFGQPYRLPSEAEWEYAARAGTTIKFWWGQDLVVGQANCAGCGSRWDGKETAPVGSFPANPFGLHDTVGNVWEWVADCWHGSYRGAPADGSAWLKNCRSNDHVLRGGSWYVGPWFLRVSNRDGYAANYQGDVYYGVRLAQDLNP